MGSLRKTTLAGITLLATFALAVAACGGGAASGDADAVTPAESPVEPPPPAPEPEEHAAPEHEADEPKANKKNAKKKRRVTVALGTPNEFDLVPSKKKVKAGNVTFKLKNNGAIEHELIVIRTDLDSGELPTDANGAAVEDGAIAPKHGGHATHVGVHVQAGENGNVTLKLKPGSYALVCNLPGHYAEGMHANFTVT